MILKWNVFTVDLNPIIGSEQRSVRPAIIISDDDFSTSMPLVTILPITTLKPGRRIYPNEVLIEKKQNDNKTGLIDDSIILIHQIRTISKKRLLEQIGSIEDIELQENINDALRIHLNL